VTELLVAAGAELHGDDYVVNLIEQMIGSDDEQLRQRLFRAALRALSARSIGDAVAFGERQVANADAIGRRDLARLHVRSGGIQRPLELFDAETAPASTLEKLTSQQRLLERPGFAVSRRRAQASSRAGRVLYVASQSMPHHSSGYAIRTHGLVRALHAAGTDISVTARYGYPNDRFDFVGTSLVAARHEHEGVTYRFSPERRASRQMSFEEYQEAAVRELVSLGEQVRPAVLHGASNFQTGMIAIEAARRLGIPSVYEVRGMWHYTRAAKEPLFPDQDLFRLTDVLESQCATEADRVLAITNQIRLLLVDWGVDDAKITLVPNCVNTDSFQPQASSAGGRVTLGFIGSFAHYEGLALLVDAMAVLVERYGDRVHLLLVGDGSEYCDLKTQVRRRGLGSHITMTGRVPHNEVEAYYRQIDVLVYPRTSELVCEVVSPLKPLEAMAMSKAVVASNVAALADMVADRETGLLHQKDDCDDLVERLVELIESPELRAELGRNARNWVVSERDWSTLAQRVAGVYAELGS